ncbi:MAG TPA: sigma-70 family RNA polymerase sigma factor [Anaeromyxobacter sp.]|nr:sigma-70 family RNA polymerase sigma factor [Anaeromyxobacter sp.]
MDSSERDLLAAAQAGDRAALGKLLERHQGRVYRFGMRMCRAEEDAKDVLQETLLAAARALPDFRGSSSVSTWLYTIARSFCIKQRRRSKFAPESVESLDAGEPARAAVQLADPGRGPEEVLEGRRLEAALEEAIGALEPMYREVLVLRDVEGLSAAEVAEVLGLSVEAVKSRLHRARVAVRERVAPALLPAAAAEAQPAPSCRDVVEIFSRRLEGEIDSNVCAELESHLQDCAACRGRCDSLRATLTLCQRVAETPVPPQIETSVREALRRFLAREA